MAEKETISRAPRGRTTRTPVGVRARLSAKNKDPEFEYRFVTDKEGRVEMFKDAGWEVATGAEDVSNARLSQPSAVGTAKEVHVGNGDKAVLMKIKREWYDEDQRTKQELTNEKENAQFRVNEDEGQYGNIRTKVSRSG